MGLQAPFIKILFYIWLFSFTFFAFYKGGIFHLLRYYLQRLLS